MLQELAAGNAAKTGFQTRMLTRLVQHGARHLLRWQPAGSVMVELPTGQKIRFGSASREGEPQLRLHNYRLLGAALQRGTIGFADAYIDGDIECSDLVSLFQFFVRNIDRFEKAGGGLFRARLRDRIAHYARRNSRRGSRRNISEHYDLGNDFYRLWLDSGMNYSSGLYAGGNMSLEAAQEAKLDLVLDCLDLSGGETILEIGCGWGDFARQAASAHNAKVTGLTLSREQQAYARNITAREGLSRLCEFRLQDYRDAGGQFDRLVSIEMIEAVGEENWPLYFQTLHDRLRPGGTAAIQAITISERRFKRYRRKADFIQRYIFPGGMLPTPKAIAHQATQAGLVLERVERFGPCYARTLREWRRRFESAWPQIAALGFDESFRRKWRYYLAYCEAGFEEGVLDVGIYKLRKP